MLCWLVGLLLGALFVACAFAQPAWAHAALEGASPAVDETVQEPPTDVTLLFDEPVQASLGGIRVFDPNGRRVDAGATGRRDAGLQVTIAVRVVTPGTYTVAWSVVSDDGHAISGSYLFAYKQRGAESAGVDIGPTGPTAAISALGWFGRTLGYVGTLLVVGVFGMLLGAPFVRNRPIAATQATTLEWTAGLVRVLLVGLALTLTGSLFAVVAQTAVAANRGTGGAISLLGDAVKTTRFGRLGLIRMGAAFAAIGPTIALGSRVRRGATRGSRSVLLDASTALLIVTPAAAGHAWTVSTRAFAVVTDAVHLLSIGTWVGGFVVLLVLLREQETINPAEPSTDLLQRFSWRAGIALVAVVATGTVATVLNLDSFADLFDSTYGRLIVAKFVLVGVLGLIGLRNRREIARHGQRAVHFVRRSLVAEIIGGLAIVGVAAVLVNRAPTRAVTSQAASITTAIGADRRVSFTLFPARRGSNDVHLYFFTKDGITAPVDVVEVRASVNGLPPRPLDVLPITPTHYQIRGAQLPNKGTWRFDISIALDDHEATTHVEVPIR